MTQRRGFQVALLSACFAVLGCQGGGGNAGGPPASHDDGPIAVSIEAATVAGLPNCNARLAGQVGYVTSTSKLYACSNRQWGEIACGNGNLGDVAYASTSQTLLACIANKWTPIASPQGMPGANGKNSLLAQHDEPMGMPCANGGIRIDTGVDDDGDGVLDADEVDQTSYLCNGTSGGAGTGTAGTGMGGAGSGEGGMSGTGGGMGGTGGGMMSAGDPIIPMVNGECPMFQTGTITFMGLNGIQMKVGPQGMGGGSLLFYWHGTGSNSSEVDMIPAADQQKILGPGGIIVSFQNSTGQGGDCSGTATFSQGDFEIADQITACAVQNYNIDPHRIYTTGCSAGGLQAGCMGMVRSNYIAAVATNSGGSIFPLMIQNPSHVPAAMTMHGAPESDVVIVDFSQTSLTYDQAIKAAGGFAVNCNHGGGHCGSPAALQSSAVQFLLDHPFGVAPEPYTAGLPSSFPSYCAIF